MNRKFTFVSSLKEVAAEAWNNLEGATAPFLRHEHLFALEKHNCLEPFGWYSQHLLVHDDDTLIGAMPLYIKTNNYGEFVFDWMLEQTYQRHGREYYPKLVSAIPYTPVVKSIFLTDNGLTLEAIGELKQQMISATMQLADQQNFTGVHWLFMDDASEQSFIELDITLRTDCHFHWHNQGYSNFDHFLEHFKSRRRKKVKRERRRVQEQLLRCHVVAGSDITESMIEHFYQCYQSTFLKRSGIPTLSKAYFYDMHETMTNHFMLSIAYDDTDKMVASSSLFHGDGNLYGRHWGCLQEYDDLHFEACYYQPLDWAIANNIDTFEPGVQGEHKIARGFLPTLTRSAHWLLDSQINHAYLDYCKRERGSVIDYQKNAFKLSPFTDSQVPPTQKIVD